MLSAAGLAVLLPCTETGRAPGLLDTVQEPARFQLPFVVSLTSLCLCHIANKKKKSCISGSYFALFLCFIYAEVVA